MADQIEERMMKGFEVAATSSRMEELLPRRERSNCLVRSWSGAML
jgi:hypothetical protein